VPCMEHCKCIGCKNIDDSPADPPPPARGGAGVHQPNVDKSNDSSNPATSTTTPTGVNMLLAAHRRTELRPSLKAKLHGAADRENGKQPFSFVTSDVVEATCQCLLAQAEDAESRTLSQEETEGMIIGEFGRCLKQIIDMANKAAAGIKATGNADG